MPALCFLLMLLTNPVYADVYKSVNEHGEVMYSDQPAKGAKNVPLPDLPTYTPQPLRTTTIGSEKQQQPPEYTSFSISSPTNDSVIRNNLGTFEMRTKLQPALDKKQGHAVRFYLDGNVYGEAVKTTRMELANLDRGEHRLSASVIDARGAVLISTPVITVHIKRVSKLHGDRAGTVTDNPGFITDNPNRVDEQDFEPYKLKDIVDNSVDDAEPLDPEIAEQPANPGFRNRNPNVLSSNPNVISPNPGLINPPLPKED